MNAFTDLAEEAMLSGLTPRTGIGMFSSAPMLVSPMDGDSMRPRSHSDYRDGFSRSPFVSPLEMKCLTQVGLAVVPLDYLDPIPGLPLD